MPWVLDTKWHMDPGTENPSLHIDQNSVFWDLDVLSLGHGPWKAKCVKMPGFTMESNFKRWACHMEDSNTSFCRLHFLGASTSIGMWRDTSKENHIRETKRYDFKSKLIDIFSKRSLLLLYTSQFLNSVIQLYTGCVGRYFFLQSLLSQFFLLRANLTCPL